MAVVLIPPLMRDLTGGLARVAVPGTTVGQVIASLEAVYPGFRARLCQGDDISPYVSVFVNGEETEQRLFQPVEENSEVLFLPAFEGG